MFAQSIEKSSKKSKIIYFKTHHVFGVYKNRSTIYVRHLLGLEYLSKNKYKNMKKKITGCVNLQNT